MDDSVVQAAWVLELEERAGKKGGGALAVEGGGEVWRHVSWSWRWLELLHRVGLYGWRLMGFPVKCRQCNRVRWISSASWEEGKGREEE